MTTFLIQEAVRGGEGGGGGGCAGFVFEEGGGRFLFFGGGGFSIFRVVFVPTFRHGLSFVFHAAVLKPDLGKEWIIRFWLFLEGGGILIGEYLFGLLYLDL